MICENDSVSLEPGLLSNRYGLDYSRVLAVAKAIEQFTKNDDPCTFKNPYDLVWRPSLSCIELDEALCHGRPDRVLSLFETEDIKQIARRAMLVAYLAHEDTPLYSLPELSKLTDDFADYLSSNKSALVSSGYPVVSFPNSLWLATRLAQSYYSKCPIGVDTEAFVEGKPGYVFAVETDSPPSNNLRGGRYIRCVAPAEAYLTTDQVILELYSAYRVVPDASSVPDLTCFSKDEMRRLAELREGLVDAKTQILKHAAYALCNKDADGLWRRSLDLLTKAFTKDEVDFLIQSDARYTGYNVLSGAVTQDEETTMLPPGGFTDLLCMLGHIEKEIQVGTFAHAREALTELVSCDLTNRSRLVTRSYFELVGTRRHSLIDSAYADLAASEAKEKLFWSGFRQKASVAISNDFRSPQTVTVMVTSRDKPEFDLHIRPVVDAIESALASAGVMPQVLAYIVDVTSVVTPEKNVFRKQGEMFQIVYARQTGYFDDSLGMRYIQTLLTSPNIEIHVADLDHQARPAPPGGTEYYDKMSADELEAESLTVQQMSDFIIEDKDREGYKVAQDTLLDLKEQIKEAHDDRLPEKRIRELQEQQHNCADYLRREYNIHGARRNKDLENIRTRVTKAIAEALDRIGKNHKPLATHLSKAIHTGCECQYVSDRDVVWLTD